MILSAKLWVLFHIWHPISIECLHIGRRKAHGDNSVSYVWEVNMTANKCCDTRQIEIEFSLLKSLLFLRHNTSDQVHFGWDLYLGEFYRNNYPIESRKNLTYIWSEYDRNWLIIFPVQIPAKSQPGREIKYLSVVSTFFIFPCKFGPCVDGDFFESYEVDIN